MGDTPSEQDLRLIKQQLPSIRREAARKPVRKASSLGRIISDGHTELCRICAAQYAPILSKDGNADKHCPDCRKRLDAGETALICISGRYAFIQNDGSEQAKKLAGQVVPVTVETMNQFQQNMEEKVKNVSKN